MISFHPFGDGHNCVFQKEGFLSELEIIRTKILNILPGKTKDMNILSYVYRDAKPNYDRTGIFYVYLSEEELAMLKLCVSEII